MKKSLAEMRANYIARHCKARGTNVLCEKSTQPIEFFSIMNERGDMASVSGSRATYEPALYAPKWGDYMLKWAKEEGFSDKQIQEENLIRPVELDEAIDLLSS